MGQLKTRVVKIGHALGRIGVLVWILAKGWRSGAATGIVNFKAVQRVRLLAELLLDCDDDDLRLRPLFRYQAMLPLLTLRWAHEWC